ncbi:TSN8 protein, partial [Polypterus senegalus]
MPLPSGLSAIPHELETLTSTGLATSSEEHREDCNELSKLKIVSSDIPAVNLLIAIGSIIMVLGFLGCCGAIRESRCMLLLFFIGLLLIFLLLVAAGIVGIVYKSKVEDGVKEALKGYVPITSQTEDIQNAMNSLQSEAKCCGIFNGASDWGNAVPDSCKCQLPNNCTTSGTTTVYKLTWTLSSDLRQNQDSFNIVSLRRILGYHWFDVVLNESRMKHITCSVRERKSDLAHKILIVEDPCG